MRLIDADALAEKIQEKMNNGFPANKYLSLYAISCIAHAPTVCDMGQIRAEIETLSNANPSYWHSGDMVEREEVLDIIDKYSKEQTNER